MAGFNFNFNSNFNFSVTQHHIDQFNEDGYLIVERLIEDATVETLRACYDRLFNGEFETGVRPDEVNWQMESGDPSLTRQICNGWKADRDIAKVVLDAKLGEAVAKLGGWPGTRIMSDNVLWKPAAARSLGHHQDSAFLDWYTPSDLLSCWFAMDDTSAQGGTIEFVKGSHTWKHSMPEGDFHGPAEYRKYMEIAAEAEGVEPEIVYVEVPKGGGSFHHGWVWHGSGDNKANHPRRSLVLHAMRSDTTYDPANLNKGTGPIYSRYKRLNDNIIDENFFPVLWREDGYRTTDLDDYLKG